MSMMSDEVIDLKERKEFLDQYLVLRNRYAEVLLTSPVTRAETEKWLKHADAEVRGLVQGQVLLGVVLLYVHKGGEVAFFVKEPNKGVGSQLLHAITQVALDKGLKSIWAWVLEDNIIAQKAFEKNGFTKTAMSQRTYRETVKQGLEYTLML